MGIVKHFRSLGDEIGSEEDLTAVHVGNMYSLENTQGYNDYYSGYSLSSNPYNTDSQLAQNIAWQVGWLRARQNLDMFGI